MPAFIPINPPPQAQVQFAETNADTEGPTTTLASYARVEEKVRDLVLGYQAAMKTWANGLLGDAQDNLDRLCENVLVCHKQEPHIESECNAYCMEYSGVPMTRMRFLVFANAGHLHMAGVGKQTLAGLELKLACGPVGPDAEEALGRALTLLTAALQFDTADATHYLAIGHCALLLGQTDVALSALSSGIGPVPESLGLQSLSSHQGPQNCTRLEQAISNRFGPRQWWCVKAIVQTSLVRGDTELACNIVNRVAELNPDLSHSLLLPPNLHPPVLASLPTAVSVLHALYSLAPQRSPEGGEVKEVPVLNIRANNDRISLIELGSEILDLFEQSIKSMPETASSALHTRVAFAISEEPTANTDSVVLADPTQHDIYYVDADADADAVNNTVNDCGSVGSSNIATEQQLVDATIDGAADADRGHASADEAGNGCLPRSNKRRESLSGDEMPAKRRSTRFIERASSGVSGNVSSAGINSIIPGLSASRTSAARSSQRRALALSLDAVESPAYCRARDLASAWFEATGAATQSEFFDALSASASVASAAAHQARLDRGVPTKSSVTQSTIGGSNDGNKAEWGLADVSSKSKGASSGDSPLAERRSSNHGIDVDDDDDQYMDSLTALIMSRSTQEAAYEPAHDDSVALNEVITSSECQAVLEDNHGIVDLLLRFIDTAALRFYLAPADFIKSKGLKRLCLCAVQHTFDVLLDLVGNCISLSKSIDALQRALRQATFVLLLLTDATVSQPHARAMWTALHAAWSHSIRSSMASAEVSASEQCAGHYLLSEAWTCYEIDVLANDVSSASVHIEQCSLLLGQIDLSGEAVLAVSCAFSGELLSLDLVRERQQHLALFKRLSEAYRLARKNEQRAADMLSSILAPFSANPSSSLPFRQRISAVRLLASLYRQKSAASDESRVILYELTLYLSRLLAYRAEATIPARAVFVRSVECLRRLYEMAEDNLAVGQYLEKAAEDDGPKRLVMQLVAVSLAIACHYAPDPVLESPSAAVEADFVGLAFWLAAKLGSNFDVACLEKASSGSPALPDDSDEVVSLDSYTEFLSATHELLGERGACTSASGALLKHLLVVCRRILDNDRDHLSCWDVAASCLRCLFDIRLHSSSIQVHVCEHLDMDAECANLVYLLVEPELVDAIRIRKGTGLRSDLKAILERVTGALGDLDIEKHPRLSMNMDVIDDYLDGTSMPSFGLVDLALRAGALELPDSRLPLRQPVYDSSLFAAYLTQPFVRAAAQHESLLFRMRSGLVRAVGDYDKIFDDYRLNIALGAEPSEAWYHLGRAFSDLADEMLLGTASEIAECRYDIALLQRRSLSCAIQASQQLPPLLLSGTADKKRPEPENIVEIGNDSGSSSSQDDGNDFALRQHVRVASSTGHLLYRIAARPLPLLAFRVLPSSVLVSDDGSESGQQWDIGEWSGSCDRGAVRNLSASLTRRYVVPPQRQRVYTLARVMFARASKLDPSNWEWAYMLGKIAAKLGDSLPACALYLKASHLAVSGQTLGPVVSNAAAGVSLPEVAMDALCKLLTSLSKLLLSAQIDAAAARRFVSALPTPCAPNADPVALSSTSSDPPLEGSSHHGSGAPAKPVSDPELLAIFCAIRSVVSQMCASDKRRRHHRSLFLLSWIDHRVLGESERAKQALSSSLLNMRTTTKQLASFYKTDFEAPGKHYLYLEKYLALYVETLVATLDIAGVQLVLRKLGRSSDSLHAPSVLQQQAAAAELEILQRMARNLNCPKFVVDSLGKEHIILHDALSGASSAQIYSITRHCRLNRPHFNHARDIARDNISFFMAQRELLAKTIAFVSSDADDSACANELGQIRLSLDEYLAVADKAMPLFGHLLDQKKRRAEEPETMDRLHDCLADVYMLILSVYGQCLRTAQLPPSLEHSIDEVLASFRNTAQLLLTSPPMKRPEGLFWQNVVFDEARHEPSQQYKLLDPLLEFQVNKLLDTVRDAALAQQSPIADRVRSDPAAHVASPTRTKEEPLVSLIQAHHVSTTADND
ncbi:Histone transcription regulator 3 [Coemansia sp. S146]|nr:Histone transcription regulator 3 [Coemansia sp. S146]